jgi:uncharacterized protein YceH (UPF0502 family)
MDADLKQYLDAKFQYFEAKFNDFDARFNDVDARFNDVDARFNDVDARFNELRNEIAAAEIRLRAHTEEVETRLLSEFWKWARTADARYRQGNAVVGALDYRVQAIEDRVAELERRPR